MNVYQRPLFRNMGGPVAPAPMAPQPMPAQAAMGGQDPMALMQAAEQVASEQTQGLGAEYAQSMINNLDAAETPEDVINAIRGNQMPLESRYRELAEYVGEEDAGQTPQSVLALVQPTLMMTEEGAMNSGIGELMQNITGEVEMITEEGLPTDMGQGVGSLMMSGVGQQPVANFSQGGFVQRFQEGGEASRLQQIYSEMLPVYQSIMGDGSDARRMTQSQILFDIADRAAAFAGGVDPRTGQSVAGASPAAQLGVAMTGLGGTIGSRLAAQDEQDRALRLAALQAAQGEYSAERAAARASSGRERGIGDAFEIVGPDGQIIDTVRLRTQDDFDRVQSEYPDALIREARDPVQPSFEMQTLFGPNGEVVTLNVSTPEAIAQGNALLAEGYTDQEPPTPEGMVRLYNPNNLENVELVAENSTEMRQAYQMGFRTLEEIQSLSDLQTSTPSGNFVNVETADGEVISLREDDPRLDQVVEEGGRVVSRTAPTATTSPLVNPDLMSRYAAGETSAEETAQIQAEIADENRPSWNPQTNAFETAALTPLVRGAEETRNQAGLNTVVQFPVEAAPSEAGAERDRNLAELGGNAFGTRAFLAELANTAFAIVDAEAPFSESQQAVDAVNALNQDALIAFRSLLVGRPAQDAINQFATLLPNPATISGSPSSAASEVQQIISLYRSNIAAAEDMVSSGTLSQTEQNALRRSIVDAQRMIDSYDALLMGIRQGPSAGNGAPDPASFRRNE